MTIHEVFKKNNITPLSVSYPGAQSDTPILPEPDQGRQQKRIYIDNIGVKDQCLILQENKGKYTMTKIKEDVDKISMFKTSANHRKALVTFTKEHSLKTNKVIIGVGFGESITMSNTINQIGLDKIDYFLIIDKNINNWKIYSNISKDIFKIKSGKIKMPLTYEVPDITMSSEDQLQLEGL